MQQQQFNPVEAAFIALGQKIGVEYHSVWGFVYDTLADALKAQPTDAMLIEYATLCLQTGLNPLLKSEVAPLCKGGRVSLIVMRDGWRKIARNQEGYNGMDFRFSDDFIEYQGKPVPAWIECTIYEKNIDHPFTWRTPFNEAVVKSSPVWTNEPTNMLQIRAMNRAIRNNYGLAVYDADEAREIQNAQNAVNSIAAQTPTTKATSKAKVQRALQQKATAKAQPQQAQQAPALEDKTVANVNNLVNELNQKVVEQQAQAQPMPTNGNFDPFDLPPQQPQSVTYGAMTGIEGQMQ